MTRKVRLTALGDFGTLNRYDEGVVGMDPDVGFENE